jgi:hypothetical protein
VQGRTADSAAEETAPVLIDTLLGPTPGEPVGTGERITLEIAGTILPYDRSKHSLSIGFRVRALDTGEVIFDLGTVDHGMAIPERDRFELEAVLDFNVAPGLYAIESHVWDAVEERELHRGPSLTLDVRGGPKFWGKVQMNPRLQFHPPRFMAHAKLDEGSYP